MLTNIRGYSNKALQNYSLEDCFQRFGLCLKYSSHQSDYREPVGELHYYNTRFRDLLHLIRTKPAISACRRRVQTSVQDNSAIQKSATELYELFNYCSTCTEEHHSTHSVNLCLEARQNKQSVFIDALFAPRIPTRSTL
jgi:hypothetical protein